MANKRSIISSIFWLVFEIDWNIIDVSSLIHYNRTGLANNVAYYCCKLAEKTRMPAGAEQPRTLSLAEDDMRRRTQKEL